MDKKLGRNFISQRTSYIGLKRHYKADFPDDLVALHNFNEGYCGLSQVENGHVNLCFLTSTKLLKHYGTPADLETHHLRKNPYLRSFLRTAEPVFEQPLVISQVSFAARKAVEKHVLMTGDAAGLIHPLCGNGMAMAIHSAKIAADKVKLFMLRNISREQMEKEYRLEWNRNFERRLAYGKMLQSLFGRNGISALAVGAGKLMPALMRRCVRLSHGSYFS